MTIYLDSRSEEVDQNEELEEDVKLQQRAIAAAFIANLVWKFGVVPIVFFLLWNSTLVPIFALPKIGYLKSVGILVMASLLTSKITPNDSL